MGQLKLTPVEALTYDDYAALPDDGQRWELIDGDLYVVPAPSPFHQTLNALLVTELVNQLFKTGEALVYPAPIDVILSPHDTFQPDVVVVRRSRAQIVTGRGIEGVPDLVIEILSPSNKERDRGLKRSRYEAFAVPEYWIVDGEAKTVEVLVLSRRRYSRHAVFKGRNTVRSHEFGTVGIRLTELFAPL